MDRAPRESLPGFENFEAYFRCEIRPFVSQAEARRRKLESSIEKKRQRVRHITLGLLAAATVPCVCVLVLWDLTNIRAGIPPETHDVVFAGILAFLGPLAIVYLVRAALYVVTVNPRMRRFERFGPEFSSRLAGRICSFFSLRYERDCDEQRFPAARFTAHGLTDRVFHRFEDHIEGEYQGIPFQVADCWTGYDRYFSRAVLMVFSFPKHFSGETRVSRHSPPHGERVELEDPGFERKFDVYSTDQVEARYLLTPTFMERVLALTHDTCARAVELVFADDRLYIAFTTARNWLDLGSMKRTLCDRDRIDRMLDQLSLIYHVIDTLDPSLRLRV